MQNQGCGAFKNPLKACKFYFDFYHRPGLLARKSPEQQDTAGWKVFDRLFLRINQKYALEIFKRQSPKKMSFHNRNYLGVTLYGRCRGVNVYMEIAQRFQFIIGHHLHLPIFR
jgi:hypothetical protein